MHDACELKLMHSWAAREHRGSYQIESECCERIREHHRGVYDHSRIPDKLPKLQRHCTTPQSS